MDEADKLARLLYPDEEWPVPGEKMKKIEDPIDVALALLNQAHPATNIAGIIAKAFTQERQRAEKLLEAYRVLEEALTKEADERERYVPAGIEVRSRTALIEAQRILKGEL